ncbi:hypothetical protein [Pseudoflavonifractor sp.]|uniref:hypothetical protein n=1 Tax=Pseudoflavonifractor sp. TaxID=1980281 RepID=UPI003D8B446E
MELNLFEDQLYLATWTEHELGGRGKARLVIEPIQCFGSTRARTLEMTVYPAQDYRPRKLETRLPEGLYRYFLSDCDSGEALTPPQEVFFGRQKSVELRMEREQGGFKRVVITSPLPLRAGDCSLDYGVFGAVPLPEARDMGERYEISFLLRTRRELPVKLSWTESLKKILVLPEKLEDISDRP